MRVGLHPTNLCGRMSLSMDQIFSVSQLPGPLGGGLCLIWWPPFQLPVLISFLSLPSKELQYSTQFEFLF